MTQQAALGDVVFSYQGDLAYTDFTRVSDGGWLAIDRANRPPASQVVGRGLEKITIAGEVIGPSGQDKLQSLRDLQAKQSPQALINGAGVVLGQFKVLQVTERQGRVIDDGTSLVTGFTLELEQFADA